jgi:hypothetical protein
VLVHDRAANVADWLVMSTVGGHVQRETWKAIVERVVQESGGTAPAGVQHESETVDGDDAAPIEEWLKEIVVQRKRDERESGVGSRESMPASGRPEAAP